MKYQGLSKFPTTSLDKLCFTPCSVRDIVQDLKNSSEVSSKCEDQCSLLTDSQAPSSGLDSPMSISSGSSAPSLASSTLSPVDSAMINPFPSLASSFSGSREAREGYMDLEGEATVDGALGFNFSRISRMSRQDSSDQLEDSLTDSGVQSSASSTHPLPSLPPQDASSSSQPCTPDSLFSPTSSLPQASISPVTPSITSPCYSCCSSTGQLSPMSLDNSNSNSPLCSPSKSSSSSFSPTSPLTSPVSCLHSVISSTPSNLASHAYCSSPSTTMTYSSNASLTSPVASSSSSSTSTKVVFRKERGKRMVLARPNSIAFSSYPNCGLVSPGSGSSVLSNSTNGGQIADPMTSSQDDTSEELMSVVSNKRLRSHLSPETQARIGRTSWGAYSEKEVYRQITQAMESAMVRTQAYVPKHLDRIDHLSSNAARKARSLDDIMDSNDCNSDVRNFHTNNSTSSMTMNENSLNSRVASGSGDGSRPTANYRASYSPEKNVPVSMLFEQYHCGIRGGPESYQSNSSLSSAGSHSSIHSSLEIIQVS